MPESVRIPALAAPVRALLVRGDGEPVAVGRLVQLDVLDQRRQLLRAALCKASHKNSS